MERKKIEEYIDKGLEEDLLDKLNSYVIDSFDYRTKNLIEVLIILQEKSKVDWMKSNQALIKVILKILPELFVKEDYLNEFLLILKESAVKPYKNISFLIRQIIISIEDKDETLLRIASSLGQLKMFQEKLLQINIHFLSKAVTDEFRFNDIITIFYNCVNRLEAERKTIIDDKAIKIFRDYLTANPEEYLKTFIRPLYSGGINKNHAEYYLHVAEPFYPQIFKSDNALFLKFLETSKSKVSDKELIIDLKEFTSRLLNRPEVDGSKTLMLKSEFFPNGLELKSRNHVVVRPELR